MRKAEMTSMEQSRKDCRSQSSGGDVLHVAKRAALLMRDILGATGPAAFRVEKKRRDTVEGVLSVGAHSAFLRTFTGEEALEPNAARRISALHQATRKEGFLSQLLGGSDEENFILIGDSPTNSGLRDLNGAELLRVAKIIGEALGSHSGASKSQKRKSTWYEAINRRQPTVRRRREAHRHFLEKIECEEEIVSATSFSVWGLTQDAKTSSEAEYLPSFAVQPRGWELLKAATGLVALDPIAVEEIIEALAEGWMSADRQTFSSSEICTSLMRIFLDIDPETHKPVLDARKEIEIENYQNVMGEDSAEVAAVFFAPYAHTRTVKVNDDDVASFEKRLNGLMQMKGVESATNEDNGGGNHELHNAGENKVSSFCITCAGHCCLTGGKDNFAYLSSRVLHGYQSQNPTHSVSDVVKDYVDHIPEEHVEGGCLYQSEKGCVLPRSMRSPSCTTFLCPAAKAAYDFEAECKDADKPILFVARELELTRRRHLSLDGRLSELNQRELDVKQ